MKSLATLEADLWLAQRAHRRNPSEENQAAIEAIEAEIAKLSGESTDTSENAQLETTLEPTSETPAESTDTSENAQLETTLEPTSETPAESTDAQATKEPKPKKQSAPKKKEIEAN